MGKEMNSLLEKVSVDKGLGVSLVVGERVRIVWFLAVFRVAAISNFFVPPAGLRNECQVESDSQQ